jgi:prolyl oligopeptidase
MSKSLENHTDEYLWLEEVEGAKALEFVRAENTKTIERYRETDRFKKIEADVRKIIFAKDRMPDLRVRKGELYNIWQDDVHVKGIWRKCSIESYQSGEPQWQTLLDLDKLAKEENENWVWRTPLVDEDTDLALIYLSRGGKDAVVIREFDLKTNTFVKDGFQLPEAKGSASWINRNELLVETDFGPDSMTTSGYPRIAKVWKRGTPLSEAKEVLRTAETDMRAWGYTYHTNSKNITILGRIIGFYEGEYSHLKEDGQIVKSPFPLHAEIHACFEDFVLVKIKSDFAKFKGGSILASRIADWELGPAAIEKLELVFEPTESRFPEMAVTTKNHVLVTAVDDIVGKVFKVHRDTNGKWNSGEITLGREGVYTLIHSDSKTDNFLVNFTDFLTPISTYIGNASDKNIELKLLTQSPPRFVSMGMHVERYQARSADGTMIPYFVVSKTDIIKNGKNPTVIYGYGGFEYALQPNYLGSVGKVWLEEGGVYVLANLRGGGEYGPKWHQSVLKENRYKVYQDLTAIAEDLIQKQITSPKHLGIWGGSNGGLLVGATATLRPDLFNAVLCQVPLLDMLRYHKMLAGASWMDEYGDPEDSNMREHILKYSPYQKVNGETKYPEILFMTSTKDDRVHPGHARKMYAKMKDLKHPVLYYENMEGGHGGVANLEQHVFWKSLELSYLWEKLK